MPSQGSGQQFNSHNYPPANNWPHFPPGIPPFIDDRYSQPLSNNIPPYIGPPFQGNQLGLFRGPIWRNNMSPQNTHYNHYGNNLGSGSSIWQHNGCPGNHQGQSSRRGQPHSSEYEREYRCCVCTDHLQNSEERGIHLCDGGERKVEDKINFCVNQGDIETRLESLLQELKGCLRKKYESVTQSLESYVTERIDQIHALHKDVLEDKSILENLKSTLEEKSAHLEKQEKDLREKERKFTDDRKKFNGEVQEEKEEICRQWQQLRDEIDRMEKVHEVQKGRIKLDVGGCQYTTSKLTLTRDVGSMLAAMFSGRYPIKLEEDGTVFIDRDGTHFRYILNYLRDGGVQLEALPRNRQVLRELKREAIFYQLHGLVQQIEKLL